MTQYWGAQNTFFKLILYNFKNIGGGGGGWRPPYSAIPVRLQTRFCRARLDSMLGKIKKIQCGYELFTTLVYCWRFRSCRYLRRFNKLRITLQERVYSHCNQRQLEKGLRSPTVVFPALISNPFVNGGH